MVQSLETGASRMGVTQQELRNQQKRLLPWRPWALGKEQGWGPGGEGFVVSFAYTELIITRDYPPDQRYPRSMKR